jgi:hypothetical protein
MSGNEDNPAWDQAFAGSLVGATVLVGLTFNEPAGERQEQFFGVVESVSPSFIRLALSG